jgi:hypothetical protein
MTRKKKDVFSKVSAVKSNARDRIGTPKASFAITPKKDRALRYKPSYRDLIHADYEEETEENE